MHWTSGTYFTQEGVRAVYALKPGELEGWLKQKRSLPRHLRGRATDLAVLGTLDALEDPDLSAQGRLKAIDRAARVLGLLWARGEKVTAAQAAGLSSAVLLGLLDAAINREFYELAEQLSIFI